MKREELIAYDRWLTENKWGSSEIVTPEQAADLYLAEHPLPPAEGAEKSCLNCRFHNSPTYHDKMWCRDCQQFNHYEAIKSMAGGAKTCWNCGIDLRHAPDGVTAHHCSCGATNPGERQPQPTAEGAENVTEDMYEKAETFLQSKDVWNHPYISDRENKTGYEVTFLIAEFATLHAQQIADKMVSERMLNFIHWLRYRNFTDDTTTDEDWLSLYHNDPDIPE